MLISRTNASRRLLFSASGKIFTRCTLRAFQAVTWAVWLAFVTRRLSENSICALKPGEIGEVYGRKTLAIPPILSMQMLFLDSLLAWIPMQKKKANI